MSEVRESTVHIEPPNGGRGLRCSWCGHYESEHSPQHCSGAYGTLMADADDHESVEVPCRCDRFFHDPSWLGFEVRS